MTTSTSTAHWNGDLKTGSGQVTVGPDRWEAPFTAPSRFEGTGETTTPEELLAAAHAGCYSMALSNVLAGDGHTPDEVRTVADVVIERVDGKPAISTITLRTVGKVPGIDEAAFTEYAQKAKEGCPVSKLFAGGTAEIKLEVSFES